MGGSSTLVAASHGRVGHLWPRWPCVGVVTGPISRGSGALSPGIAFASRSPRRSRVGREASMEALTRRLSYPSIVAASEEVAWTVDEVFGDRRFDPSRPIVPASWVGIQAEGGRR